MRAFFVLLLLALTPLARAELNGTIGDADQVCDVPGGGNYDPDLWMQLPEGEGLFHGEGVFDGATLAVYFMDVGKTVAIPYPGVTMTADDATPIYLGAGVYVCVSATDTDTNTAVTYELIPIRTRDGTAQWHERKLGALPAQ